MGFKRSWAKLRGNLHTTHIEGGIVLEWYYTSRGRRVVTRTWFDPELPDVYIPPALKEPKMR